MPAKIRKRIAVLTLAGSSVGTLVFLFFWVSSFAFARYFPVFEYRSSFAAAATSTAAIEPEAPLHIATPSPVRAIYMSSWVAGTKGWREELLDFAKSSEINAVMIDVKDYTGKVSFDTDDPVIAEMGAEELRVRDMEEFIEHLHENNIYVIARISSFQDSLLAVKRPDIALKRKNGSIWKDRKGIAWVDPASREAWDYIIRTARAAEKAGFDELNFDYVRYPSDGDLENISYPLTEEGRDKSDVIASYFSYLNDQLDDLPVPISVDLFGLTTHRTDDMGIGQILEKAAPYVDYIAPMVYPSHYPDGFNGFKNPADHPYEVIYDAMVRASERLSAASSTPRKLRPWIQDFDLGATYDAEKIRAQKKAIYDAGLDSWMSWDPKNKYTRAAYIE